MVLLAASLWWYGVHASRRVEPEIPTEICFVAAPTPYDPRSGVAPDAPRAIPPHARCPVCGAFPSRVPDWAAQVIFADGDAYFFDSPLSLFIYLRNLPRYAAGRQATDIAAAYVRAVGDGAGSPRCRPSTYGAPMCLGRCAGQSAGLPESHRCARFHCAPWRIGHGFRRHYRRTPAGVGAHAAPSGRSAHLAHAGWWAEQA
ncbi:hypothetical protein [Ralstonia sp. 1B3]|uniref:hypothetical protein n=1 Tax=Ralstonia sp. 1B3 TaxID=2997421 RepID=UPI002FC7E53B